MTHTINVLECSDDVVFPRCNVLLISIARLPGPVTGDATQHRAFVVTFRPACEHEAGVLAP